MLSPPPPFSLPFPEEIRDFFEFLYIGHFRNLVLRLLAPPPHSPYQGFYT
ncbi:hypothetical protein BVC80_1785g13 [Macleaya cordata]|uniref:Uncharacterized protein n=1 Tax=Macleaya cordata TaxID=56857 RepID=A0A200QFN2_MACCD|nr:hypothetical protein BVC80_1785g13 [Macleaya cordata]